MRVLSLGWGTQSWALAAMAAMGELQPLDAALFADTRHERQATYDFAQTMLPWLETRGVHVVTVRADSTDAIARWGGVSLPAYTTGKDGQVAQVNRQCTHDWKVAPIRRWLQTHRQGHPVDLLLGISLDEVGRMRDSDVKYVRHSYPLIDRRMTRGDCVTWLERHGLPVPERSACVMCPFQSGRDWQALSESDRQHAVRVDEEIRLARPPVPLYVHRSLRPLALVDLRGERERGQLDLWDAVCGGHCGV